MISALQDLVKQEEAIANIDTKLNLNYKLQSYKPMPNERLDYQWRGQESCINTSRSSQKRESKCNN